MSADIIKFPKAKQPRPFLITNEQAAANLKASADALVAYAEEHRIARELGDSGPMHGVRALANLFTGDDEQALV